ncbi:DUF4168 domain-containing protein [Lyngbya aestuarii]|uniref:DUF4168 domain-containing protein n=1 Tax=Lyngbya aestuarii TaxID=118322 RepID=UPI00403D9C36
MTNPLSALCQSDSSRATPRKALTVVSVLTKNGALVAKLSLGESRIIQIVSKLGLLAGLTALAAGCASSPASDPTTSISPLPSVSPEEVQKYAKAVWEIEQLRQTAENDILQISEDGQVPEINCTQADTISNLQKDVQKIAVNYCNKSKTIGESYELTMATFNGITVTAQENTDLKRQIQNELIRLQR